MPIEFRCTQCNQLLRVPDDSAGKAARCPKCQALLTVPAGQANSSFTSFGPGETGSPPLSAPSPAISNPFSKRAVVPGQPTPSPFGDATGGSPFVPGAAPNLNPYASPAAAAYSFASAFPYGGARPGLPWEVEPKTLGCWFRTMGMVVGSPSQAFSLMRQYGGLGTPLLFNVYAVGMVMALIAVVAVPIMLAARAFAQPNNNRGDPALIAGIVIGVIVAMLFYGLLLVVVVPCFWSGVSHLALYLVGGARHGFETTFRAISFAYFSALLPSTLLGLIPYLGGVGAMIWILVLIGIALSRAHEISGGKAAAAVVLPFGICCGIYMATVMAFLMGPNFMR